MALSDQRNEATPPPAWISESQLLLQAFVLAEAAHRAQDRPTDGRPFLDHVTEVAWLLDEAGFDEELVAVGLLHDAVERGTLSEEALRAEMGDAIATLVLALTEDAAIESFEERKTALREQVREAGGLAVTVFAADKLSDIVGLRRGIERYGRVIEERMGAPVAAMAGHYRESVELIELARPGSAFLPRLHAELDRLEREPPTE
jgi:guanosine-3',5'-bis(diphosphate) 3'-pyrophosphohydrolase